MGSKLGFFVAGGLIGAAAVFFTSPRSGFENRNLVKDTATAVAGSVPCSADACVEQVKQVAGKGQELCGAAVAKVKDVFAAAPATEETASEVDDLRKKIDEARQRIAAQVLKNAEEAQDAVSETVEVIAEATEALEEAAAEAAVTEEAAGWTVVHLDDEIEE